VPAIEDPIAPSVQVNYTKLLINGRFVDAASGKFISCTYIRKKNKKNIDAISQLRNLTAV
jgi:hypothetical protein